MPAKRSKDFNRYFNHYYDPIMCFVNLSMSVCVVYNTRNSIYSFLELITDYNTLTGLANYTKCYKDNPTDRLTCINIHVDDRVLRSVEVG